MGQGNTKSGVIGWGSNDCGQLGSSDKRCIHQAKILESFKQHAGVCCISAKGTYAAAVSDIGEVWTWGTGELGLGCGETVSWVPRPVRSLQGKFVRQISCGENHCAAVTDSGSLYTWGRGLAEPEHSPRLVEALVGVAVVGVACGDFHTLVHANTGAVFAFGLGLSGRLGLGDEEDRVVPTLVFQRNVLAVAAGGHHSAVLVSPGVLYTFGGGSFGKLGHGDAVSCLSPKLVTGLAHVRLAGVALGQHHSAALSVAGDVYVWGQAQGGSSCQDVCFPEKAVEFGFPVAKIFAGKSTVWALTHAGNVFVRGPVSVEIQMCAAGFAPCEPITKQQCYSLMSKGVVDLAIGDNFCIAMADPERPTPSTVCEESPTEEIASTDPPPSLNRPHGLMHVMESAIRLSPPVPPNPTVEAEMVFLSSELKHAQIENQKLNKRIVESQTRIAHLERENVSLREELDASMQCLPVRVGCTTVDGATSPCFAQVSTECKTKHV